MPGFIGVRTSDAESITFARGYFIDRPFGDPDVAVELRGTEWQFPMSQATIRYGKDAIDLLLIKRRKADQKRRRKRDRFNFRPNDQTCPVFCLRIYNEKAKNNKEFESHKCVFTRLYFYNWAKNERLAFPICSSCR